MTAASQPTFPAFGKPPVAEVALSVQFEPLPEWQAVHVGMIWQEFRSKFKKSDTKPRLAPQIERLGTRIPLNEIQFQVGLEPGTHRSWFVDDEGGELIQIQSDRFVRNWRSEKPGASYYPRYIPHLRKHFVDDFTKFQKFTKAHALGSIIPTQCELTYVNHIQPCDVWSSISEVGSVFKGWNKSYDVAVGIPIEQVDLRVVHQLKTESLGFVGRLHVQIQSAYSSPSAESEDSILVLTLTARGKPFASDLEGSMQFFDFAHATIVRSFDRMTSKEMHRVWEKQSDGG